MLEQYHVPATFFEIGDEVARYPQYSKMVVTAGYPVEDHTWSHPDLTTLPASGVAAQIDMAQAEIEVGHGDDAALRAAALQRLERHRAERDRRTRAHDHELLDRPEGLDAARACRPS